MARGDTPYNLHRCETLYNVSYFRSNEHIFQRFSFVNRCDRLTERYAQGTSLLQRGSINDFVLLYDPDDLL